MCYGMCGFENYHGECTRHRPFAHCPHEIAALLEKKRNEWVKKNVAQLLAENKFDFDYELPEYMGVYELQEGYGLECPFPHPERISFEELASLNYSEIENMA